VVGGLVQAAATSAPASSAEATAPALTP
jgi:hypothetical protein